MISTPILRGFGHAFDSAMGKVLPAKYNNKDG
jgi:hypothetical protein